MSGLKEYRRKFVNRFFTRIGREKSRIKKLPRYNEGFVELFDKKFFFHDSESFLATYFEIFEREIYCFRPHATKRTILDCGANIGLSVLYFSLGYPAHRIIAFEPDEKAFQLLERNVANYGLQNVQLFHKAVWTQEECLEFYTDNGLGGRIGYPYSHQQPRQVSTVRLKDYISDDIDFLKIDIEGSEYGVLQDCRDELQRVNNIFFEYHRHLKEPQTLHELLEILDKNGFRYYIKDSSTRDQPFMDQGLICESYDMAINIFGYRLPGTNPSS